jgi:transcriptional regulator with XRE-family HTH domain
LADIGSQIVCYRKKKGMTQEQLAEKSGVLVQQVSRYERGLQMPSVIQLKKIADALDISINYLCD